MKKRKIFSKLHGLVLLTLLALMPVGSNAQEVVWSVGLDGVFDNREGDLSNDQTIVFTRLKPEVGISLFDGKHTISGGVVWDQPMGNGWKDYRLSPTVYYRYKGESWRMSMGMFPRTQMMEQAPKFLWSDSIDYRQPNIRGLMVQYVKPQGYAELILDWRQLQTESQREAFNVDLNSRYSFREGGVMYIGERLRYNHLAKQKHAPEGQGVNDDFVANVYLGADMSRKVALDSLNIRVGVLMGMQRCRMLRNWEKPVGVLVEAAAQWRWLGVRETFYAGNNQMPLYALFGGELNMGSPYYQAGTYSRTDVYANIIRNKYVDLQVAMNFHVTKNVFALWQQVSLKTYIDSEMWETRGERSRVERLCNMY